VIQNSLDEKEMYLKELVIKILEEKHFSDYAFLDSLFNEIKEEIQKTHKIAS